MIIKLIAGFLSGIIGAMGMGGGAVLIIYLTVFAGVDRFKAQGINLIFFIPIAAFSVIIYLYRKKIDLKTCLPFAAFGLAAAAGGIMLSRLAGVKYLSFAFGTALILIGLKEIITGIKTLLEKRKKPCYNKNE